MGLFLFNESIVFGYEMSVNHITYRYIDASRHNFENFLSELLGSAIGCSSGLSSFKGDIMEEDNFQNFGGKDQYIYI